MESLQNTAIATELFAIMAISLYGIILSYTLPPNRHFVVNIICAATVGMLGFIAGLTPTEMGLSAKQLVHSLPIASVIAASLALSIYLSARITWLRKLFSGSPFEGNTGRQIAYAVGVRIPLSTALLEEVLFRGVLLGLLMQDHPTWVAIGVSSVIFGIWHIFPTVAQMEQNIKLASLLHRRHRVGVIIGTVLTTTLAGIGFGILRVWTGSLLTPWLIHWSINGSAALAARSAARPNKSQSSDSDIK